MAPSSAVSFSSCQIPLACGVHVLLLSRPAGKCGRTHARSQSFAQDELREATTSAPCVHLQNFLSRQQELRSLGERNEAGASGNGLGTARRHMSLVFARLSEALREQLRTLHQESVRAVYKKAATGQCSKTIEGDTEGLGAHRPRGMRELAGACYLSLCCL